MRRELFVIAWLLLAPVAAADDGGVGRARELARDAGDLIDEGRWEEALARASEAETLYHAPTHAFMIGRALEGLGRLVEAMTAYERLVAETLPPVAPKPFRDAQTEGRSRLNALLARVPSVLVRTHGAPPGEVTVTLDGKPFAADTGQAGRVDPGQHTLQADAAGYRTSTSVVTLLEHGGVVPVDLTLEPIAAAPPATPPPPSPPRAAARRPSPFEDLTSNVPATVALGVGATGLAVGAVSGLLFLDQLGDLEARCPQGRCGPGDQDDIDATGTVGNVSTAAFVIGSAGIVTGAVLFLLASTSESRRTGRRGGLGPRGLSGAF